MDTELMGASGPRVEEHMCHSLAESAIDLVLGHRVFRSSRTGRELFAFFGIAANRQFNEPVAFLWYAPDKRFIYASNGVLFELRCQMPVSDIRLGNHHYSRCLFIQSMDEAWPLLTTNRRDRPSGCLKVMQQGVDQRSRPVTRCRMHDDARRFVEDQQVLVFKKYLQRNRLASAVREVPASEHPS